MEARTKPRVVCVDDEPQVLSGISLHLRRRFEVELATSGAAALDLLARQPPAAVLISDMRMPGMDGAKLLAEASARFPTTTRILLTGHANLDSAIVAVNDGHVFRFLIKPCPPPELVAAVEAAADVHRVAAAERTLLEQTLQGSIRMLTEVMALTNPVAFGKAQRLKHLVDSLCDRLELADRWEVEIAALLTPLSTFTLPSETLEKLYYGAELSAEERAMVARTPDVTEQLLANIPRLEGVRAILSNYEKPYKRPERPDALPSDQAKLSRLTQVLRVVVDFDALEARTSSTALAISGLNGRAEQYCPEVLAAFLAAFGQRKAVDKIRDISVAALRPGMVFASDVKLTTGTLFVGRGYQVTPAFLDRIRNFRAGSVKEPVQVLIRAV
jgi:response regulator RpfG family c-di-GMP phosphodiesterase